MDTSPDIENCKVILVRHSLDKQTLLVGMLHKVKSIFCKHVESLERNQCRKLIRMILSLDFD